MDDDQVLTTDIALEGKESFRERNKRRAADLRPLDLGEPNMTNQ